MSLADALPDAETVTKTPDAPVRPFYWCVRREIWDNRSLYTAPLATAGLIVFGFIIGTARSLSGHWSGEIDPGSRAVLSMIPYAGAAVAISITGLIVAAFYCLGALYNERRDRSILFWKSMPVSDLYTVLAKFAVPMVLLPTIVFVITVVAQLVLMLITGLGLAGGSPLVGLWTHWPLGQMTVGLAWTLIAFSLWYAPVWAWLVLISAWAKRAPFLWAVLPPLGLMLVEEIAFGTSAVGHFVKWRLGGAFDAAFIGGHNEIPRPDLAGFFSGSGVYVGVAIAAALIAAAVWLRRSREPT